MDWSDLAESAEVDLSGASWAFDALPNASYAKDADRSMRIRLLSSSIAGFEGEYGWPQYYGWPVTSTGSLSPMFLSFIVKNLPRGGGESGARLRLQLIKAAIYHDTECKDLIAAALKAAVENQIEEGDLLEPSDRNEPDDPADA